MMSDLHGRFVWYELMTKDLEAAQRFYDAVIGWGSQDSGMPGIDYRLFKVGEQPVAGLMAIPEDAAKMGMPPKWVGYIGVRDVDARTAAVAEAGGKVFKAPEDIPGVGRFSIVADPQGAMFALMTGIPPEEGMELTPNAPGHGAWAELFADDASAAFDFYAGLLGWTKGPGYEMGPMGLYQLFNVGDLSIGGMMNKPEATPFSSWNYYFTVDGIDAAIERVAANGGKVSSGPNEVPGPMWVAQCNDPQGAFFGLVSTDR